MPDDVVKNGAVSLPVVSLPADDAKAQDFFADNPNDPMNDTKREIRTRFELLPADLQKVIIDDMYPATLLDISRKNNLTYEELGTLEIETTMVLLGMTKPADYRTELQEQLKKNDAEADTIVKDVNEKIFAPVRIHLEKLYSAAKDPADYLKTDVLEKITNPGLVSEAPRPTQTPPAAQPISPTAPALTQQEKSVLEKTGVVINTPPPAPIAPMTMPSRSDVLRGIENPPKAPSIGMVGDKLKASTPVMPALKMTDYSVAKPVSPSQTTQPAPSSSEKHAGPDPYREPIN